MSLAGAKDSASFAGFPRLRGDEPDFDRDVLVGQEFSPPTRG